MFRKEVIADAARCLSMPFNIAAGDSSGYNYASGRLDHQTYFKSIRVLRRHIERSVLSRVFTAWLKRAVLVEGDGGIPQRLRREGADLAPAMTWHWDGAEHVDPQKEANAQAVRLANLTTTLRAEYARQGKDWREELQQQAEERRLIESLGLTPVAPAAPVEEEEGEEATP